MKRATVFALLFLIFATAGFAQKPVVVGICPFFDNTGTPAGEKSATMLPVMFLEKAKSAGFVPIILNLGPEWSPSDTEWPAEVARMAGADAVLFGQVKALATSKGKKPSDEMLRGHVLLASHAADLVLSATLLDATSGHELSALETVEHVKGDWFTEAAAHFTPLGMFHHESFWFADTHFGQAITRSAEKLISDVGHNLSQVAPKGSYNVVPGGASCRVKIRVLYKSKNRASKMYLIAVNSKEESMGINDGMVEVSEPSGPILLHVTVKDAPYRQPFQNDYYANSMLDCSREANTLSLEIGSAGEALIRWR
ncbi:MAG TPA: hypothetical protein VG759_22435 [Candidatus Angelobacter sp.]|jgi:hypothetical protein|nr:hypothetical protein [Candidatus Angelobacter sp.]